MKNLMLQTMPKSTLRLRSASGKSGFTLIELLVVIAIISILAALIFPVFSTAQENARQGNTMEHMHDISAALALYKLDNKTYPPVLFAYAYGSDSMATIGSDPAATSSLVGLYPEYVKDWHEFTCADDLVNANDPTGSNTALLQANALQGSGPNQGLLAPASTATSTFYKEDAFDVGPEIDNTQDNKLLAPPTFLVRYQTNWTPFCDTSYVYGSNPVAPCDADYLRQLRWQNPPADTYVTAITYHVPNANKLLVLYEAGTVKKVDYQPFTISPWTSCQFGSTPCATHIGFDDAYSDISLHTPTADPMKCGTSGAQSCNTVQADFWKFDATGH